MINFSGITLANLKYTVINRNKGGAFKTGKITHRIIKN